MNTLRRRRISPSDASAMAEVEAVIAEATSEDGGAPISDQALLAARDGSRDLVAFCDAGGGSAAAIALLGEGELDLVVRPSERGRGVGSAALEQLLQEHERSGPLRAWVHGENPAAQRLLEQAAFSPVRTLYRLALDPALLPPEDAPVPALPEPFRLVPFDPDRAEHRREWVRVNARAFASHPEQGAMTLSDLDALTRETWFRPEDLLLAWADGEHPLGGFTWIKTLRSSEGTSCELYVLAVDPDVAGRGLGRDLMAVTLATMARRRPVSVTLYVDGDNVRAREIYRKAGFTVDTVSRQWELPSSTNLGG